MTQIHLIMPFSRHYLKEVLIDAYRPMGIIWHPIMFQNEAIDFNEPWIIPLVIPMQSEAFQEHPVPWSVKRNYFIENCEIIHDDYYVAVDDDDMYEAGVFDKIKQMNADIVIISMKRGYNIPKIVIPKRRYPTDTLIAHPDNVKVGFISNQQSFFRGKIYKKYLYDEIDHCDDGRFIIHHKDAGEQIRYEPDLYALFNYYEPGRWTKPKIAFGVLVNDLMRLDMVFRQSEIDVSMPVHTIKLPTSACKGLNKLLDIMTAEGIEIAILSHQDMFYRQGWLDQVMQQIGKLPENWIVAGPIGKDMFGHVCGRLHDMRIPLHFSTSHEFPQPAACFDECCIIVNMKKGFRFDERMPGFDLYGTLAVLQAKDQGGTAWILDAFAEHYCMRSFDWYPDKAFENCYRWLHERFPKADRIDSTVMGLPEDKEQEAA